MLFELNISLTLFLK